MDSREREARAVLAKALAAILVGMSDKERDAFWSEYRLLRASPDDLKGSVDDMGQVRVREAGE